MQIRKAIICSIAAFVAAFTSFAQDAKKDITAINKAYEKAERLSMAIEYTVYLDGSSTPYEKENGIYRKDGNNLYLKQMDTEIMSNERNVTIVNHETKVVMMDKSRKIEAVPWEAALDTMLSLYKSVKYYIPEGTANIKAYTFHFHNGQYESVDVWFNASTFLVEKIRAKYRNELEENGRMHKVTLEMNFRNMDTKSKYPSALFTHDAYVSLDKGKYTLRQAYKNYRLINHLTAGK